MYIRFLYKVESQLKFANILELSLEQIPHKPQGRALHISLNFPLMQLLLFWAKSLSERKASGEPSTPYDTHFLLSAPGSWQGSAAPHVLLCSSLSTFLSLSFPIQLLPLGFLLGPSSTLTPASYIGNSVQLLMHQHGQITVPRCLVKYQMLFWRCF